MLRYGDHLSQFCTLTLPSSGAAAGQGSDPWPVAVILHGGFWRTAYGAELGEPLAEDLARHGFAAWNVEYRRVGSGPAAGGGGWPNSCLDVAAAVDLLASAGQQQAGGRLDLSRVVALGHSAGGHLAGWLAGRSASRPEVPGADPLVPITGLVSQAGVLDLALALDEDLGAGAARGFLGAGSGDSSVFRAETLAQASPAARVPTGVPSVCVHGTADDVVPINQSERYVAAALAAGDAARLVAIPGADHSAPIDVASAAWAACRDAARELTR